VLDAQTLGALGILGKEPPKVWLRVGGPVPRQGKPFGETRQVNGGEAQIHSLPPR
jgi:hypothetical protein